MTLSRDLWHEKMFSFYIIWIKVNFQAIHAGGHLNDVSGYHNTSNNFWNSLRVNLMKIH